MVEIALGVLAEQGFRGNVNAVLHKQKKRPNFSVALFVENTGVEPGVLMHPKGLYLQSSQTLL